MHCPLFMWSIEQHGPLPKCKEGILIAGLPGIGNVGKMTVDFILEQIKAKKLCTFFSYSLPASVLVNEQHMVDLPNIALYHKKGNYRCKDLFILAGDAQPAEEHASYQLVEKILEIGEKVGVKEVITLGGIGLGNLPQAPKIYCTGNCKAIIDRYASPMINRELYGVVGPIIGTTGLLLGLGKKKNIEGIALLAETLGHPMYLGIKGSKQLISVLNDSLKLNLDVSSFAKGIKDVDGELGNAAKKTSKELRKYKNALLTKETSYIG